MHPTTFLVICAEIDCFLFKVLYNLYEFVFLFFDINRNEAFESNSKIKLCLISGVQG